MKGLWLCLHGPRFELDVVALGDTQPKALVSANGERVQQVCSKAQRQGVRPGMTVSTALSLEPELQLFTADTAACRQRLEGLALWVGRFSARVSFEPSLAGEPARGVVLEIGSMLHYFGGLAALWSRLESELAGLELDLVCATGHTPLAAVLLARAGGVRPHVEDLAVRGTGVRGTDVRGTDVRSTGIRGNGTQSPGADVDGHHRRLGQLSLSQLALPRAQLARLQGLGFQRVRDLLALPTASLASRLGPDLTQWLKRLTGAVPDLLPVFEPPPRLERELELNHDIELAPALLFPLKRLLMEMEGFLHVRCAKALSLQLTLYQRDAEQHISVGHAGGEQSADAWLELCRLRLERCELNAPVRRLRLEVSELTQQEQPAQDLFDTAPPRETADALFSRLRTRLGQNSVMQPRWREDHRPERASTLERCTRAAAQVLPQGPRPAWLLPTPLAMSSAALSQLEWLAGPERLASGWWDAAPARRDYYVVRFGDARCGWIFRDHTGQWWLHGWFG